MGGSAKLASFSTKQVRLIQNKVKSFAKNSFFGKKYYKNLKNNTLSVNFLVFLIVYIYFCSALQR